MYACGSLQAASEDELRLGLGLQNYTSGKGKVELKDSSMRPIEIFMCSVVRLQTILNICPCCSKERVACLRVYVTLLYAAFVLHGLGLLQGLQQQFLSIAAGT